MNKRTFFSLPILFLFVALGAAGQTTGKETTPVDGKAAVEHVLRAQQEAWNHHDLDGFVAAYWNSPELTFFSGAKQTAGWQGTLEFCELRIEMLGPEAAFVRGAWHLTMPDGKTPHGLFTLIFRKFPEGWKIVHDHTSAAE